MNINRAFSITFKDKDWIKKTLLGGLFFMIPFVNLFAFGFLAKLIHSILEEGNRELPSWENWGTLFWKGLEWGIIIIIYLAIPLLILSLLPQSVLTFVVNPNFVLNNLNVGGYLWFSLSVLLSFFVLFFLPMALMLFAETGSFLNAFYFNKIYTQIKKKLAVYLVAYIFTIVLFGIDFFIHLLLTKVNFGIVPSYFLFMWIGFIILLISGSLFTESF